MRERAQALEWAVDCGQCHGVAAFYISLISEIYSFFQFILVIALIAPSSHLFFVGFGPGFGHEI